MVLGPEQKIPDGNLQLCVIDSFLFEIRLKPVTEIYHIMCFLSSVPSKIVAISCPPAINVTETCSIQRWLRWPGDLGCKWKWIYNHRDLPQFYFQFWDEPRLVASLVSIAVVLVKTSGVLWLLKALQVRVEHENTELATSWF